MTLLSLRTTGLDIFEVPRISSAAGPKDWRSLDSNPRLSHPSISEPDQATVPTRFCMLDQIMIVFETDISMSDVSLKIKVCSNPSLCFLGN